MKRKIGIVNTSLFALAMIALLCLIFGGLRNKPLTEPGASTNTIIKNTSLTSGNVDLSKFVIDVSAWQRPSDIDYNTLSQNIIGAIVRVQAGKVAKADSASTSSGEDTAYKQHIQEFQARNIPVAVYAYVNGDSVDEMKQQAKDFYARSNPYHPTYYWLDVEEDHMSDLNAGIDAYRNELESLGVKNIGIYAQDWFITANNIDVSKFSAVWMAAYGPNDSGNLDAYPNTSIPYDLHQFTSHGWRSGYSGYLDLNIIKTQKEYNKLFLNKG
ncbi:MAG: glycoside hydrolase family 25 protein [Streptococcaceae bacterium]|nr:glycoside hydrolase family 25 protein [Streptococcaceae bacterium]